jgi:mersacidin/lichenicidin family type 2 lantibiotic
MSDDKSNVDVARAWRDAEYRDSLSAEQRAQLPPNPAGNMDVKDLLRGLNLSEDQLEVVRRTGLILVPTILMMSPDTSGGTQCTAHSCRVVFNPTIRILPEKTTPEK